MSAQSSDRGERVISLVPHAFGSGPFAHASEVLPGQDRGFYFVPDPAGGPPLGPYRRDQILDAVRLFRLSPYERIWVTGLNSWLVLRDVFREAFEGSQGRRLLREWDTRLRAYARFERPGTMIDLGVQSLLTVPLIIFLAVHGMTPLVIAGSALLVPVLFWATSGLVFHGRSFGMQVFGVDYVKVHNRRMVRGPEAVLRGVLSFLLFAAGGIEIIYLLRSRSLLSSQILGIKAVFNFEGLALAGEPDDPEDGESVTLSGSGGNPGDAELSADPSHFGDTVRTSARHVTVATARPAREAALRHKRAAPREGTKPGRQERT